MRFIAIVLWLTLDIYSLRPFALMDDPPTARLYFEVFLEGTNQLEFITDDRSEKIQHIEHQPWAEICWYFPNTREQFRLSGLLTLVAAEHPDESLRQARQKLWQTLSDAARSQFAWSYPGKPRAIDDSFSPPPPAPDEPLPHFRLLLLEPTQVDHLELRGNPQNRYQYIQEADAAMPLAERSWSMQEVNP